jgi:hypothetical protein
MLNFLPKSLGEVCPYYFAFNFIFINRFFKFAWGPGVTMYYPLPPNPLCESMFYLFINSSWSIFILREIFFIEIQNEVSLIRSAWLMESWFLAEMQKKKKLKKNRDLCFPFQPFKHISKMLIHHSKVHGLHEKGLKRF